MNIAGIVVNAMPDAIQQVEQFLLQLPGVEIHAAEESGKMVVTIEAEKDYQLADMLTEIQLAQGVLSAAMVYHSFDDATEEEML